MLRTLRAPRALCRQLGSLQSSRRLLFPVRKDFATHARPSEKEPTDLDRISRLANGVRVATEALPGHFSGVGVYIDAGSRYEDADLEGVSHIVDRLAFKSTTTMTSDQMLETLESLGGNIQCASSRETMMYQSATFNSAVDSSLGLLADTIRNPLITDEEVSQQLETADYEIGEIWSKPDLILPELVHVAAYKDNTLGNPLLCPKERLDVINRGTVERYRNNFYNPERMVVAFVGVDHSEAQRMTEKYFGDMKATTQPLSDKTKTGNAVADTGLPSSSSSHSLPPQAPQEQSRLFSRIPFIKNLSTSATNQATTSDLNQTFQGSTTHSNASGPSRYTGGFLSLPPLPPPPNPNLPRLSYIHLAFEALPITSRDIYALATLQTLLGGGGSFSAGGPGKGMYSRLYTNVLNQYHWVESCAAFNHSYTDSGLFGISASCVPSQISQMLEVMCRELHALTLDTGFAALQQGEVQRAKNQLRSSLLMNLESRMVELEDLGRQVQAHGKKVSVTEMCSLIDGLQVADLRRVARQLLSGMIQNPGLGTGAPTVVLQEGEEEGRELKPFEWGEIQERIRRWNLGRRL